MRKRSFLVSVLFTALLASASAQVTLYSENFEGVSTPNLPAGWTNASGVALTANNVGGSNVSTVLTWSQEKAGVNDSSSAIDLTGYTSGYTFTLSFDLYNPTQTTNHSLLIGYGESTDTGPDVWLIADSTASVGQVYTDNLDAADVWQTFSFDITSGITNYLTTYSGAPALFTLFFEEWNGTGSNALTSIDNIKLTATATAVPEPSTYVLIAGIGALGLATLRRYRRIKSA